MRFMNLLLSVIVACTSSSVAAQSSTAQGKKPTVLEAACRDRSTANACVLLAAWHWLRRARVVIDPGLAGLQISSTIYALTLAAQWAAGASGPVVEYVLVISRAGIQTGVTAVAAGATVVIGGTLVSAGGLLFSMTTPAGKGDELQPRCDDILSQFNSPEGLEKLLKLPPVEFEFVTRCIPKESQLRTFLQNSVENARQFESQVHLN